MRDSYYEPLLGNLIVDSVLVLDSNGPFSNYKETFQIEDPKSGERLLFTNVIEQPQESIITTEEDIDLILFQKTLFSTSRRDRI